MSLCTEENAKQIRSNLWVKKLPIFYLLYLLKFSHNPVRDYSFRGCSRITNGGKQKGPPPKNLPHISHNDESDTFIPYLKKIHKHLNDMVHPFYSFLLTSYYFT